MARWCRTNTANIKTQAYVRCEKESGCYSVHQFERKQGREEKAHGCLWICYARRRSVRGIVSSRQQIGTASASHARGTRDKSRVNVPPIATHSHHGAQSEGLGADCTDYWTRYSKGDTRGTDSSRHAHRQDYDLLNIHR